MTEQQTITILTTSDVGQVQGSTEQHYVVQGLAADNDVHLFGPVDPEFEGVTYHPLPQEGAIPAAIWYNIVLLPLILYHAFVRKPAVIYAYKGFILPPVLCRLVFGTGWICDLRTAPTEQDREVLEQHGRSSRFVELYFELYDLLYRLALPYADRVISLSPELAERLETEYGVKPSQRVLVPLGVDTERFDPAAYPTERDETIDCVYLGSVRLHRGLECCIEALGNGAHRDQIDFHIIGGGPDEEIAQLKELAAQHGVTDTLTWHGFVDHDDIPAHLAEMDVAVSPYPAHERYLVMSPAKVYEYLAMGLPVICSELPAHRQLLTDGTTGFFFQPGNATALADQFERVRSLSPEAVTEDREQARAIAVENDWQERIATVTATVSAVAKKS